MADSSVDTVARAISIGSVGFGVVATASPGTLRKVYGDSASSGATLDYFGRTWGTRTAVLGVLSLMASSDEERKRIAMVIAAMNVVDSLSAFRAKGMPAASRVMAGLTSAGFAGAGAYVAMNS